MDFMENRPEIRNFIEMSYLELLNAFCGYVSHCGGWIEKLPSLIGNKPFDRFAIDDLIRRGWSLTLFNGSPENLGFAWDLKQLIAVNQNIKGYERDSTLFHESLHAWYVGKVSNDGYSSGSRGIRRGSAIELLARTHVLDK